ncbi:uncharacterized protein [Drosophila kikkawai]|uniref:Uncharacterized protein isoform X2 n=1 Tax=Drosophila kikkawai TaxID=30033 RepID=A0A6P4J0F0_DROKI|nr:uncharacterized protein LOC108079193 isoform X2 [Drosophila kikkawai]
MIATLRRQHGGGRDFLQENKQRVSRMETNGRCLAAASARRVPLWRPVALHYPEKLRPHINLGGQRRTRHEPSQKVAGSELRSGLAQPYTGAGGNKIAPPCGREMNRRQQADQQEQVRLQGGWVDPRRKERPVRRCCHPECQCHQSAEVPVPVSPPSRQGEGDQVERLSQCPSRISRHSMREERSKAGEDSMESEAPLSARSRASTVTIKSKRSVSQESNRSNVTVKSNITVASKQSNASRQSNISKQSNGSKQSNISKQSNASKQSNISKHTITSKRSQLSQKSGPMEEMPPPEYQDRKHHHHQQQSEPKPQEPVHGDYEGYTPLTADQKQAMREDAQFKYGKLMEEYNHLPVSAPTLRVRSRRIAIEKQLDELDYAINMFDQPHMDMYYRR